MKIFNLLAVAVLLASCTPAVLVPWDKGAFETREYRNVFVEAGYSPAEVDEKLHAIMANIHEACVKYGTQPDGYINYVKGANIAGFMKVAQAMLEQGII